MRYAAIIGTALFLMPSLYGQALPEPENIDQGEIRRLDYLIRYSVQPLLEIRDVLWDDALELYGSDPKEAIDAVEVGVLPIEQAIRASLASFVIHKSALDGDVRRLQSLWIQRLNDDIEGSYEFIEEAREFARQELYGEPNGGPFDIDFFAEDPTWEQEHEEMLAECQNLHRELVFRAYPEWAKRVQEAEAMPVVRDDHEVIEDYIKEASANGMVSGT